MQNQGIHTINSHLIFKTYEEYPKSDNLEFNELSKDDEFLGRHKKAKNGCGNINSRFFQEIDEKELYLI